MQYISTLDKAQKVQRYICLIAGCSSELFMINTNVNYAEVRMSCESDICLGIFIQAGQSYAKWRYNAYLVNLLKKYEPTNKVNLIKLKNKFNYCKLKDIDKSPDQCKNDI